MAQPGVKPYFSPGLAVFPLNKDRNKPAGSSSALSATDAFIDLTKWLKGLNYVQEANIGDSTAVGDRSMGKSTGKPDNGNLEIEIMRSYSSSGPMTTLQNYVSYPCLCMWADDVGADATIYTGSASNSIAPQGYRWAICYITGIVHTDANVQNADASSMSMSWPIDGDVYYYNSTSDLAAANLVTTFWTTSAAWASITNFDVLGG